MSNELGGKARPPIRVLDLQTLPTTPDILITDQLVVLVRPDFVIAAPNVAALRSFNAVLDHNTHDFAAIPFGQRMARTYEGGVTAVAGADMQEILKQATSRSSSRGPTTRGSPGTDTSCGVATSTRWSWTRPPRRVPTCGWRARRSRPRPT